MVEGQSRTALNDADIEAEVDRYIGRPGQALGYKPGEVAIRRLRATANAAQGAVDAWSRALSQTLKRMATTLR